MGSAEGVLAGGQVEERGELAPGPLLLLRAGVRGSTAIVAICA
ncbi:hypothetical protein [Streptomyces chrestomyceticus]